MMLQLVNGVLTTPNLDEDHGKGWDITSSPAAFFDNLNSNGDPLVQGKKD